MIKYGDVVRLKSGGPLMTVVSVLSYEAHCQWFAGNEVYSQIFMTYMLMKDELGSPPENTKGTYP